MSPEPSPRLAALHAAIGLVGEQFSREFQNRIDEYLHQQMANPEETDSAHHLVCAAILSVLMEHMELLEMHNEVFGIK